MKLIVIIKLDDFEKRIEIPCGLGDKSFKWLAMTAYQRFSLAAPNGLLRRSEGIRGQSEKSQHLPFEVSLSNGEVPHPGCILSDFVKDGDEVYVELSSSQKVDFITGSPDKSKWSSLAFHASRVSGDENESGTGSQNAYEESEDEEADDGDLGSRVNSVTIESKANFMKIILRSQIIDHKIITRNLEGIWTPTISSVMPNLKPKEIDAAKISFKGHWDMLIEFFNLYCADGKMDSDGFHNFIRDCKIFSPIETLGLATRIFQKTCLAHAKSTSEVDNLPSHLGFSGFLVALILTAQTRFHDTYDGNLKSLPGTAAIAELFSRFVRPFAEQSSLKAVVKEEFCSQSCLYSMRSINDNLITVFNKYAGKTSKSSNSISIPYMAEFLSDSKLFPSKELDEVGASKLLVQVQNYGSIFGRDQLEGQNETPSDNFTYPEFVEAVALASYQKYYQNGSMTIEQSFLRGLNESQDALKPKTESIENDRGRKK